MFGKIIYYDKKTIDEYKAIINGKKNLEIEAYEVSNDRGAGLDVKAISMDTKATKKYTAKVIESILYDCAEFEGMLCGRDDYFDFTQSAGFDMGTVQRGCIVKLDAFLEIPEGFDIMKLIDSFKPLVMSSIDTEGMDPSGKEAIKAFLGNAKATKIPLVLDNDEYLLSAKINQDSLISDYEELEELEDEQVTVLARVASGVIKPEKPYYDPLKDFMSLNRMMRKAIKDRDEELQPLLLEREYRQIDVLAIYR